MRRTLIGLLLLALPVLGQDGEAWDAASLDVERLKTELEAARKLSGEGKEEDPEGWKKAAQERVELLDRLVKTVEERSSLRPKDELQARIKELEGELDRLRAQAPEQVLPRRPEDLVPLEATKREAEAELNERQNVLARLHERKAALEAELKDLPAKAAEARRKLDTSAEEGAGPLFAYRRSNLRLELRWAQERTAFIQTALERWTVRIPMHELEEQVAKVRADRARADLETARDQVTKALERDWKREETRLDTQAKQAAQESDPLRRYARLARIETLRIKNRVEKKDAQDLASRSKDLDAEKLTQKRLEEDLAQIRKRLDQGGITESTGELLRSVLRRTDQRRRAIDRRLLPGLARDLNSYLAELGRVQDRIWELDQAPEEVAEFQKLLDQAGPGREEETRFVYDEAVRGSDGLLAWLRKRQTALEQIYGKLQELESVYREQGRVLMDTTEFVVARIYWVRNEAALTLASFATAAVELKDLGARFADRDTRGGVARSFRQAPALFIGALAGILAIVLLCFFLGRKLRSWRAPVLDKGNGVRRVVLALLFALGISALLPAALLGVAVLAEQLDLPGVLAVPLTTALRWLALLWFLRRLAARLFRPDGIAVELFKVNAELAGQLLRAVTILLAAAVFLRLPAAILGGDPFGFVWIPRLLMTAWMLAVLFLLVRLLHRRGALVSRWTSRAGGLYRLWGAIWPLLGLAFLAIVAMDVMGYRLGAGRFFENVVQTFIAAVVLTGLYALLKVIVEKVAYGVQARKTEQEGFQAAWESSKQVLNQLTRVVSLVVIGLAILLLADFWDLDTAVRGFFEGVRLSEVGEAQYLTLWDCLVALFWILAGHFFVHNISGVYEFLVFPLIGGADKGGRYVVLALTRYAILLIAYSTALLTLHFSFSSIGWLLAAASVGLGFGLQEIVANFVSGLILLVERPIRVGDIVTVGGTAGTVEKINIRATILTNFDRQQIIVPNKDFITKELTNWTRNDQLMRRKVTVGTAYGSDIGKVLQILDETVKNHPFVVGDPPPRIWFSNFGASSLDFDIWFFTRIDQGLQAMSEIRAQIDRRFREAGIEIPFPQQDLHLRSVDDEAIAAALLADRKTPALADEKE